MIRQNGLMNIEIIHEKLDFVIDGKNITFYTINCFEDKTGMYGHVPYESTFACQKNFHYMKLTNLFFEMFRSGY